VKSAHITERERGGNTRSESLSTLHLNNRKEIGSASFPSFPFFPASFLLHCCAHPFTHAYIFYCPFLSLSFFSPILCLPASVALQKCLCEVGLEHSKVEEGRKEEGESEDGGSDKRHR